jgi:hypothetical protein
MDIVYVCRPGENEELRYSIRSVVKNLPHNRIWVVGDRPAWYCGDFLPVKQDKTKYKNVREILEKICKDEQISETFVLMNDDFFIVNPVKEVETFHGGTLLEKLNRHQDLASRSSYTIMLQQTYDRLVRMGISEPLDYDIHVPMVMSKKNLKEALKGKTLWRSTYGNIFKLGGKQILDVKVYGEGPLKPKSLDLKNSSSDYISSDDTSFKNVKESILKNYFSSPTKYELDHI